VLDIWLTSAERLVGGRQDDGQKKGSLKDFTGLRLLSFEFLQVK
jgi:hypothetical protein